MLLYPAQSSTPHTQQGHQARTADGLVKQLAPSLSRMENALDSYFWGAIYKNTFSLVASASWSTLLSRQNLSKNAMNSFDPSNCLKHWRKAPCIWNRLEKDQKVDP